MSINDRVMTSSRALRGEDRAHSSAALRIAVSGRQPAAHGLNRQPACHCTTHNHLAAGHDNVAGPNHVSRIYP